MALTFQGQRLYHIDIAQLFRRSTFLKVINALIFLFTAGVKRRDKVPVKRRDKLTP